MTVVLPIVYLILLVIHLSPRRTRETGLDLCVCPCVRFCDFDPYFVRKINAPRPYEECAIKPLLDRDSPGQSMPSRHVFSATIISMACFHASLSLGVILLVLSALLGLVRVLGGVHYPKDVVVGYIFALVWV